MIDWVNKESVTKANVCDTCGHQFSDVCGTCETLDGVPVKYQKKTNADRIRTMTDEELADFLLKVLIAGVQISYADGRWTAVFDGCRTPYEWIKQEVEE